MDNKFEQLKNQAKQIRMTESEKSLLRARIQETMEHFPIRETSSTPQPVRSPFNFIVFTRSVAFVLVGFIAGGGGLAFASEQALPGGALYPIKVNVNEEVVAALQNTPEAKIAWEEKRVERRVAEGLHLSNKGILGEKEIGILNEKFNESNKRIDKQVIVLSQDLSFNGISFNPQIESSYSLEVSSVMSEETPLVEDQAVLLSEEVIIPSESKDEMPNIKRSLPLRKDNPLEKDIFVPEMITPEHISADTTDLQERIIKERDFASEVLSKFTQEIQIRASQQKISESQERNLSELIQRATQAQEQKNTKIFYQSIREIKHILEN